MNIKNHYKAKGFTLTEVIITMILVIILSLVAMPLYKGRYSNYAKIAEGYALLGTIREAQFNYYNEYGYFLRQNNSFGSGSEESSQVSTIYDPVLGISASNNRYFTSFKYATWSSGDTHFKVGFYAVVFSAKAGTIEQTFNITKRFSPVVRNASTDLSI
ncbi:MAG: prepilin-type N-terminal cleavage/methylation domain-containing protein [Elusimicrobia bacterium]|nr:prepilin-type N-terminal cleavage/methylation domain-containing protein [Elusimicrobiota bacterium]